MHQNFTDSTVETSLVANIYESIKIFAFFNVEMECTTAGRRMDSAKYVNRRFLRHVIIELKITFYENMQNLLLLLRKYSTQNSCKRFYPETTKYVNEAAVDFSQQI